MAEIRKYVALSRPPETVLNFPRLSSFDPCLQASCLGGVEFCTAYGVGNTLVNTQYQCCPRLNSQQSMPDSTPLPIRPPVGSPRKTEKEPAKLTPWSKQTHSLQGLIQVELQRGKFNRKLSWGQGAQVPRSKPAGFADKNLSLNYSVL